jgi:hypothetical protein
MASKKPHRRTKRTREHVIADLSVNYLERQAFLCGFSVQRSQPDYGIDLMVTTYNPEGEIENGHVSFQVKASDSLVTVSEGRKIAVRVEARHFRYWLYTQAYFEGRKDVDLSDADETITVHVPRENVLNRAAMKTFARFRDRILAQSKGVKHHE